MQVSPPNANFSLCLDSEKVKTPPQAIVHTSATGKEYKGKMQMS